MKNNSIFRDLLRRAGGNAGTSPGGLPGALPSAPPRGLSGRRKLADVTRTIQETLDNTLPGGGRLPINHALPSGNTAHWQEALRKAASGTPGFRTSRTPRATPPSANPSPAAPFSTSPSPAASSAGGRVLRGCHHSRHGERDWRLYVPTGATAGSPRPLVVMLHGCTQDAEDFARGTRMDAVAEAANAFVLYPEQSTKMNPHRCWNWFKHTHQRIAGGEPAIIVGMIAEVAAAHPVDTTRVFAAGLSAGGALAAILGDCAAEQFAGVGVHSGLGAGCAQDMPSAFAAMRGEGTPVRAPRVPMIVLHGDADSTVSPTNAHTLVEAAVRGADGALCRTDTLSANGRECERSVWSTDDGTTVCERWTISGAGHAWSGGDATGSYTDATGPDASALMMDFFNACAARTAPR